MKYCKRIVELLEFGDFSSKMKFGLLVDILVLDDRVEF